MLTLNGKEVIFGRFPNDELYLPLKDLDIQPHNKVVWQFKQQEDIVMLMMLQNQIRVDRATADLYIKYMPYSRMDRENGVYSMSLRMLATVINNLHFETVVIREPHSYETLKLVLRSEADWWTVNHMDEVMYCLAKPAMLYFPDKGAKDRYASYDGAYGQKKRDFRTGEITGYEVVVPRKLEDNILIVDDLCSKGGTFVAAAKLLRERGAKHISLLVAHCEYNVLNGELFDHVDRLYCSDSIFAGTHPRITILD